jgi:hypothetical protein
MRRPQAHQGNPNMTSIVDALQPHIQGVSLQVLSGDDRFHKIPIDIGGREGRILGTSFQVPVS